MCGVRPESLVSPEQVPPFLVTGTVFPRRLSSSYLSAIPVIDLIYRGKKVEGFMVTRAFAKLGPGPLEL